MFLEGLSTITSIVEGFSVVRSNVVKFDVKQRKNLVWGCFPGENLKLVWGVFLKPMLKHMYTNISERPPCSHYIGLHLILMVKNLSFSWGDPSKSQDDVEVVQFPF